VEEFPSGELKKERSLLFLLKTSTLIKRSQTKGLLPRKEPQSVLNSNTKKFPLAQLIN